MDKKIFISFPVKYYTKAEEQSNEHDEECEDCFEEAESMGLIPRKHCPECFKKKKAKDLKEEMEIVTTHLDINDILEFFPIEKGKMTRVSVSSSFEYVDAQIPYAEFLEKMKKVAEIL